VLSQLTAQASANRLLYTSRMTPPCDEPTAYHEAGHAVVALILGRPVDEVSVLANRDFLGVCKFGKAGVRPSEDWLEREILIALGGIAAEARHTGNYAWDAAGRDQRYVRNLAIERAGERRAERLQRRLLAKVEHLLTQEPHWRAVVLVAEELMRRSVVSGRAVRHFFEQGQRAAC
jgi:ATP-dependent Zn protease